MPKIDVARVPGVTGSGYPAPFKNVAGSRVRKSLGDAAGLTQFGVRLTRLPKGAGTSQRHWHLSEDEFIYVLEGQVTLITDAGEEMLGPGEAAGFPAGVADGHCLVNKSDADAVFLEIGTRAPHDICEYPETDLRLVRMGKTAVFTNKHGAPYTE
ncbi:MAG: cupin domain-containing protein [Pseudomonadota bacterium]